MKYTEEMILRSSSGYCMPFEERGKNVEVTLGYGQQKHPVTGEAFFHHGVDFSANHYLLAALASGTVAGIGNDQTHGIYQVIRYGKYEVTYSHLANVYVNFGQQVKAGTVVALSGDLLHFEVKYDGEELSSLLCSMAISKLLNRVVESVCPSLKPMKWAWLPTTTRIRRKLKS